MDYQVSVQIDGADVLAGTLYCRARNGVETSSFKYDEGYLLNSAAFALSPDLPLTGGSFHSQGRPTLHIFADCMPDRWGRNLLLRAERSRARSESSTPRALLEEDMLVGVGDFARQGAIRIWRNETALAPQGSGVPREVSIPALLDAADLAAKDLDADVRDLVQAGSSLGGARPKASVVDERGDLSIAKFPKADESAYEDVCAWERVALQLACACGMHVPNSRLLRIGGRSVLLLKRFDRAGEKRLPYLSGLTAVQGEDGGRYSYLELVDFIEEHGSRPEADLRELWLRILFSCAIGNTDDHMRNHGFLRERGGWRLSPLFDVNPTPGSHDKLLSTSLDFERADADPKLALEVCEYFRWERDEARAEARRMADVLERWRKIASTNGVSVESQKHFSSCFEAGVARLRA